MKDECRLCKRVLSIYLLRRCHRCGKLYCRSCMTTNLWDEQRALVCLNCARRIVSPPKISSKYSSLREYLYRRGRYSSLVTLTFLKIEGIINGDLPFGALRKEEWWRNSSNTSQGHAWMSGGWKVQSVSLKDRLVTFKKIAQDQPTLILRRRRRKKSEKKTFTPVPVKPRRVRKPSKTRISKVLARTRNIERRRMSSSLKIKMKPRSAYEKRMYKPEAKPSRQD